MQVYDAQRNQVRFYGLSNKLNFGKYWKCTIQELIEIEPEYLIWCMRHINWFVLGKDSMEKLCEKTEMKGFGFCNWVPVLSDSIVKEDGLYEIFCCDGGCHWTEFVGLLHTGQTFPQRDFILAFHKISIYNFDKNSYEWRPIDEKKLNLPLEFEYSEIVAYYCENSVIKYGEFWDLFECKYPYEVCKPKHGVHPLAIHTIEFPSVDLMYWVRENRESKPKEQSAF